jgi:hypothetical protein
MNTNEIANMLTALHNAKGIVEILCKGGVITSSPDLWNVFEQLEKAQADFENQPEVSAHISTEQWNSVA